MSAQATKTELRCERCQSPNLTRVCRSYAVQAAELVAPGQKAHVSNVWVHQCECGHQFDVDLAPQD